MSWGFTFLYVLVSGSIGMQIDENKLWKGNMSCAERKEHTHTKKNFEVIMQYIPKAATPCV